MSKQTTVRLRDGQDRILEEIERITHLRADLPQMRQSEIIRRLIDAGLDGDLEQLLEDDEAAPEEIPIEQLLDEAHVAQYRHHRFKELEGWLRNNRTGFRTQVADRFKARFKNGYSEDEIREFSENYRRKAHYLWPGEEHREDRERALEYVDRVCESAVESIRESEIDPLDPETLFDSFEGVEEAQQREAVEQQRDSELYERLVEEAERRLESAAQPSPGAIRDMIENEFAVSSELAQEAVREAVENGGVSA